MEHSDCKGGMAAAACGLCCMSMCLRGKLDSGWRWSCLRPSRAFAQQLACGNAENVAWLRESVPLRRKQC